MCNSSENNLPMRDNSSYRVKNSMDQCPLQLQPVQQANSDQQVIELWLHGRSGDLELEDYLEVRARNAIINSPAYQNQQLADMIASNMEELERRKISQAMTWLVPRFEDKLDEISQKIKKDW